MSWINIDNIYLKKAGGEISGNLTVGGVLTVNNNLTVAGNLNGGLVVNGGGHTDGTDHNSYQKKIFCGSLVTVGTGDTALQLWSVDEFKEKFGRTYNSTWGDIVYIMNGDANDGTTQAHFDGCSCVSEKVYALFDRQIPLGRQIRINYLVVLNGNES